MKVAEEQQTRLDKLADIFQHVRDISTKISQMDDPLPEQLQQSIPGYLQILNSCVEGLRSRNWPFVLAGEDRTVWMSFLSAVTDDYSGLISDDKQQLQTLLSGTKSQLIRLTHNERIYFDVSVEENPSCLPVVVENWDALTTLENQRYDEGSKAGPHKIDIHLPLTTLKDGFELMVVNDSWERNGTEDMVHLLSQSYGLIYVLNLDNLAENGKFGCMLQQLQLEPSISKETQPFMVVCLTENQSVSKESFLSIASEHLSRLEESSVDYLYTASSTSKTVSLDHLRQLDKVKKNIQTMFNRSIDTKIKLQFSWLNSYIARVLYCMRSFFPQAEKSHEDRLKTYAVIQSNLETLTSRAETYLQLLKAEVDEKVDYSLDLLKEYLSNEDVITIISTWADEDAPDDDLWSDLDLTIQSRISYRIKRELLSWEEHSQYFANVRPQLIEQYERNFSGIKSEISTVEGMISRTSSIVGISDVAQAAREADDSDSLILLPTAFNLKLKQKIALGIAAPFLFPFALAAVILGLPIIGGIAAKEFIIEKVGESKLKDYKANKVDYLQRRTREEIKRYADDGALGEFVMRQLKPAYVCIHQLQNEIPRLIRADRAQILSLQKDERETADIIRFYNPLIEVFEFTKQLLMVYRVMSMNRDKIDIPFAEVEIPENTNVICDGFNGTFQTAFWTPKQSGPGERDRKLICLKFLMQKLEPPTIESYLLEEEARRFQAGPNIVKFLGITKYGGFIYHVHEPLKCSLRQYLTHAIHDASFQEPSEKNKFVFLSKKLAELLRGLDYLHDRNWVHFDISLDSVAVDLYNQVKLTNISCRRLFHVPRDISQQGILRYSHLPPEVLSQPPASYTLASEMYSTGIIMWEMWHDQTHAYWHEINKPHNQLDCIEKFARYLDNHRPSVVWYVKDGETATAHYNTWMAHTQQCWSETDRLSCKALLQLAEEAEGKSPMPINEQHFSELRI